MVSYDQLRDKLGFRVPRSYQRLLELVEAIRPQDSYPWNVFAPLLLKMLDEAGPSAVSYTAPPDFVIFGWTGVGSGHYGFVLDDVDPEVDERPVAVNYPDGTGEGLLAMTLPEFLGQLCDVPVETGDGTPLNPWEAERRRLAEILRDGVGIGVPTSRQASREAAWAERLRRGRRRPRTTSA